MPHYNVPSAYRATANSMTSFAFRGIYIITGPVVGLLIDWQGMYFALSAIGVVCTILLGLVLAPLLEEIAQMRKYPC